MEERIKQFACSGWNEDSTRNEILKARKMDRRTLLFEEKKPKRKNISASTTKWDPRTPAKGPIIHEYKNILYSDPVCKKIFPEGSIIPSNRRLRNIGEMIKPTEPKLFITQVILNVRNVIYVNMHLKILYPSNHPGTEESGKWTNTLLALPIM